VALFIPTQIFAQSGIVATPSDLNIGSFCPGETGSGVVTLTNPDDNPSSVTITGYEFVAGGWGDFSLQDPSSILVTLEPGGSVVATVLFTPAYDTTYVMTLRFYTTSNDTPTVDVLLFGDGYNTVCQPPDDTDSDGVEDAADNCPLNPNGPDLGTCTGEEDGIKCYSDSECPAGEQCSMDQEDTDRDGQGDACDPFDVTISPEKPGPADTVNLRGKYNRHVPVPGIRLIVNRKVVKECEADECENTDGPYPEGMAYMAAFMDSAGEWQATDEMYAVRGADNDWDDDGVLNGPDNCLSIPNGPDLGTCTRGDLGITCTAHGDCGVDGFCSLDQDDSEVYCVDPFPGDGCDQFAFGDGVGDACDDDDDDDGCLDLKDPNPQTSSSDVEMDAYLCLPGGFGDGVGEDCDNCPDRCNPDQENRDGDDWGDHCDNCPDLAWAPQTDTDNDLVGDDCDNCPETSNINQADNDLDGSGDLCDDDDDNDGCLDPDDDFPLVHSVDTDGDGISNDCDIDDDNDGFADEMDAFPLDPTEWFDEDGDGIGDNKDCDDLIQSSEEAGVDCGPVCGNTCVPCEWCGDNIEPLRVRGEPSEGYIDIVFVPHVSWEGRIPEFREYIQNLIRRKFMRLDELTWNDPRDPPLIEPIPEDFRERFNFYIDVYGYGNHNDCEGDLEGELEHGGSIWTCIATVGIVCEDIEHFWEYASFADVGALIPDPEIYDPDGTRSPAGCARPLGPPTGTGHQFFAGSRYCNDESPPRCRDYTYEVALHEAGHSIFGLIDEYDGDTNYDLLQQYLYNEEPSNVWRDFWGSDGVPGSGMGWCEDFALAHDLDPFTASPHTGCRHFTSDTTLPYVRFDRDDDDIMHRSRGHNSIFREACTWVITDVFNHWPSGRTKGLLTYLEFDGQTFKPLVTEIVDHHPDIFQKTHAIMVETYSAEDVLLLTYGISDPRIALGEPSVIREVVTFPMFAAFRDNIRWIIFRDLDSQEIMGQIDLAPAIYKYCSEDGYVDPHCLEVDLDANGILDAMEPEGWIPAAAVGKVCFPELNPLQCFFLDMDTDGVLNDDDNCRTLPNPDQLDTDLDGVGDPCDNCPELANPDQVDNNGNGTGDACEFVSISIDIKPGSYPNCMNVNTHGVIPVAILGSEEFDVSFIDVSTLSFAGLEVRVKGNDRPQCSMEDVSGDFSSPEGAPDGYPDLVCHFVDEQVQWEPGESTATVTGFLNDGRSVEGTDEICIVP
jgi:hypothetical protein